MSASLVVRNDTTPAYAAEGVQKYRIALVGEAGAINFSFDRYAVGTKMHRHAQSFRDQGLGLYVWLEDGSALMPTDLGVHEWVPPGTKREWQFVPESCDLRPGGGTCAYDGSGMAAEALLKTWIGAGDDQVVVTELTDWYRAHFHAEPGVIRLDRRPMLGQALESKPRELAADGAL